MAGQDQTPHPAAGERVVSLFSGFRYLMAVLAGCMLLGETAHPAKELYPFPQAGMRERFETLTSELRCLVCQNETLAESHATLAADLREEIYRRMQDGQENKQIVDYLVSRYGNFILYRPPLSGATFPLWFGPLFFLSIGMGILVWTIRSHHGKDK